MRKFTTLAIALAAIIAGCSGAESNQALNTNIDPNDPYPESVYGLTPLPSSQITFDAASGLLSVDVNAGQTAYISRRGSDSAILVNSVATVGVNAKTVKRVEISPTGANTVILDFTAGPFATQTSSVATTGIDVGATGGTSLLVVKGTSGNDSFRADADGLKLSAATKFTDVAFDNAALAGLTVLLGEGNDSWQSYVTTSTTVSGVTTVTTSKLDDTSPITVHGGIGNDTFSQGIDGALVSETIIGGDGADIITYGERTNDLSISLTLTGGGAIPSSGDTTNSEADKISEVETITGGTGDDVIVGGASNETVNGGLGNDTLTGGAGNDVLNGGDGNDTCDEGTNATGAGADTCNGGNDVDTISYAGRLTSGATPTGVTVNIDGTGNDGSVAVDNNGTLLTAAADNVAVDVENVVGTGFADVITGSAAANWIDAGEGNDTVDGGAGNDTFFMGDPTDFTSANAADGNDTYIGGAGVDLVDYSLRTTALTINMNDSVSPAVDNASGYISGTGTEDDSIRSDIENAVGGTGIDTITGNALANEIEGALGEDVINGGAGDDMLFGGTAAALDSASSADTVTCGAGFDLYKDFDVFTGAGATAASALCDQEMQ